MRIVSLCPSITETLIALGGEAQLVGITRFCIHPADITADLCKVGGTKDPNLERILALAPDLVFVNEEENRKEDFEALRAAGLALDVSMTRRVDQVPDQLRHFGAQVGAEVEAQTLAQRLEGQLEALDRLVRARPRPFTYAYLIWRNPWMAVGEDTYVADLLGRAGGRNVLAETADRYPEVSLNQLRALNPEVLFLPDEPFPFSEKHAPEVQAALPDAQIQLVSGDDCCWHGVRSLRGMRLAEVFAKTL